MKLPTAEPSAINIRMLNRRHIKMIGASHHFFLLDRYCRISFKNSKLLFFEDINMLLNNSIEYIYNYSESIIRMFYNDYTFSNM